MIKKCECNGCEKAGICRAPKDRDLKEYLFFCKDHAAEYNKNWNYYANMSDAEIEEDWEKLTFGSSDADKERAKDYAKFIDDFLNGRSEFDKIPSRKTAMPAPIVSALKTLELPITASWKEVQVSYRKFAKAYHPDTTKHIDKKTAARAFSAIGHAYESLKKYFKK